MSPESFTDLALRVIACEATDEDRRALAAELASSPAQREEFEQLKATHTILRTTAPLADATRATAPELPAHRVNELRTAVRQHFGPAAARPAAKGEWHVWAHILRWVFGGGGLAALVYVVAVFCFANRVVEVGLYKTDLMRDGEPTFSAQDVPTAQVLTFEDDAPFDQWQTQPLAWTERAKIWIDNDHDLLHIMRRVRTGQIVTETQPLAATDDAQREQIKQLIESLKN